MKRQVREAARRLRLEGRSIRDIAKTLNVSKASASVWVRDIPLTPSQVENLKRNQHRFGAQNKGAQHNREKFRELRIRYQEQGRIKAREMCPLHVAGCMLYWAEGGKKKNSVYFVNSDPHMLLLFIRFLREAMHVNDDAIAIYIHCHSSDPVEMQRIEQYWLSLLELPTSSLRKTQVKKGSEYRRKTLQNGVCGILVSQTALVQHIYGAIQEYGGFENPDWLF